MYTEKNFDLDMASWYGEGRYRSGEYRLGVERVE